MTAKRVNRQQEEGAQAHVRTERYVRPVTPRGVNQWAIEGREDTVDRRACPEVLLSAGNARERGSRWASLRIGNQVVVLDPTGINTLAVALLRINDYRCSSGEGVVNLHLPEYPT